MIRGFACRILQLFQASAHAFEQYLILVAEIMIDDRPRDAERNRDIVKRRRVETATVEHPYGRDEHCFALAFSFLDPIARRPERALIGFSRRFHD
tara:strand:- start:187 stop:471 length:285 start_codon:yes stop_codon:yes gene_type:complete